MKTDETTEAKGSGFFTFIKLLLALGIGLGIWYAICENKCGGPCSMSSAPTNPWGGRNEIGQILCQDEANACRNQCMPFLRACK